MKALGQPGDETQVLTWQGDRLDLHDHLPRAADALPLRNLLVLLFRIPTWNVVDDQDLLAGRKVQADFVTRSEGWNEAKALDQLGAALRRDLKVPVKLSVRAAASKPWIRSSGGRLKRFLCIPKTHAYTEKSSFAPVAWPAYLAALAGI